MADIKIFNVDALKFATVQASAVLNPVVSGAAASALAVDSAATRIAAEEAALTRWPRTMKWSSDRLLPGGSVSVLT